MWLEKSAEQTEDYYRVVLEFRRPARGLQEEQTGKEEFVFDHIGGLMFRQVVAWPEETREQPSTNTTVLPDTTHVDEPLDPALVSEQLSPIAAVENPSLTGIIATPDPVTPKLYTSYHVALNDYGKSLINVIKQVRQVTTLSLGDAKKLVENAPTVVRSALPKDVAEEIKERLEQAGAVVTVEESVEDMPPIDIDLASERRPFFY